MDNIADLVLLAIHELGSIDKAARYLGVPRAKVRGMARMYGHRLERADFVAGLYDLEGI